MKPKCLFHVKGQTILTRTVNALRQGGVQDIRIVVGYRHKDVEKFIAKHGLDLEVVYNPDWDRDAVRSILEGINGLEDDALILFGDIIINAEIIRKFVECPEPIAWVKIKKKYGLAHHHEVLRGNRQVYIVKVAREKLNVFDMAYPNTDWYLGRYSFYKNVPLDSGIRILGCMYETIHRNQPVAEVFIDPPIVDVDLFKQTDEWSNKRLRE